MNNVILKSLADILVAVEGIEHHLAGKRDFKLYSSNPTVKRAVECELEITAEAVARILKQDENFSLGQARQIVALRNRVIHGYDSVDDNLVWKVIVRDVPILKEEDSDF